MKRLAIALSFIIAFAYSAFAFAGKPAPPRQEVRLYYNAKETVDIECFVFSNASKNTNLNYLSTTIPEVIAEQFERLGEMKIRSDDIVLTPVNYDTYWLKTPITNFLFATNRDSLYPFMILATNAFYSVTNHEDFLLALETYSNEHLGAPLPASTLSNIASNLLIMPELSMTNFSQTFPGYILTNVFIDTRTNKKAKKNARNNGVPESEFYVYYISTNITANTNHTFIDGNTPNVLREENEEILFYNGSNALVKGNRDYMRAVRVSDQLYYSPTNDILSVLAERGADIFIYGEFAARSDFEIALTARVYRKASGVIDEITMTIESDAVPEMLARFAYEIATRIDERERVERVRISVTPSDALVYLDGLYLGRAGRDGMFFSSMSVGAHRITLRRENYETLDKSVIIQNDQSNMSLKFTLEPNEHSTTLIINPINVETASIFLDGHLIATNGYVETNVTRGSHYVKITADDYKEYRATVEAGSSPVVTIAPKLERAPKNNFFTWLIDPGRNTKAFYTIAGISGIAALGSYIWQQDLNDKMDATFDQIAKTNSALTGDAWYALPEYKDYELATTLFYSTLGLSIGTAVIATVFYYFWVTSYDFPVATFSYVPLRGGGFASLSFRY